MHLRGVSGGTCKQDKFLMLLREEEERRRGDREKDTIWRNSHRQSSVFIIVTEYRCRLTLPRNIAPRSCLSLKHDCSLRET